MSTFSTSERQKRLKNLSVLHFWLEDVLRATASERQEYWSVPLSFLHFWLGNVLRPTINGVHFSDSWTSKSGPNLVCFLKCASRHNSVHFSDICTSKSDLKMCFAPQRCAIFHLSSGQLARRFSGRRFSEVTFRPSGATNHWKKHSESWLSYPFAHLHLLSSDFLPLWSSPPWRFPPLLFHLSILSEVWLRNFLGPFIDR